MKTNRKLSAVALSAVLGLGLSVFRVMQGNIAPASLLYILLTVGMVFCLGCGLLFGKKEAPETCERSDLFKTAIVLAGIVTMGAAALKVATSDGDLLTLCAMGLMAIGGMGMILGIKESDSQLPHVMVSVPIFAAGLYLLSFYKAHIAAGSNTHIYAFEVLTLLFLTAALYSVASMRFSDRSHNPFITTTVLAATLLTVCTAISGLIGDSIFTAADLLLTIGLALYCGAWYLNPPVKYIVPEEDEADENEDEEEIIVPDIDEEE